MSSHLAFDTAAKRSFYDEFWADRPALLNAHELSRLTEILRQLSVVRSLRPREILEVCDLGCGTGWLANQLRIMGNVTGVELSPQAVEAAKRRFPGVEFIASDITTWRPEKSFDIVISSEVLEHLVEKNAFVATIDHVLRPGGWLVLTTPNGLVKRSWDKGGGGVEQIVEDWVTPKDLRLLFRHYRLLHQSTFFVDFAYVDKFRWLSAPKLLRVLRGLRVDDIYNLLRSKMNLGLYQLILCQRPS